MTHQLPAKHQLSSEPPTRTLLFRARGLDYRYVHLGNVERKRLSELIVIYNLPGLTPDEQEFWNNIKNTLDGDVDDL